MTRITAKYLVPAALAASFLTIAPTAVTAHETDSMLTQAQAQEHARSFMHKQGFTRAGKSQKAVRIAGAKLVGDTWHVQIRYGGTLGNNVGLVLVDAYDGSIDLQS